MAEELAFRHVIGPRLDHVHGPGLADMDGEGRLDVVAAKMQQARAPQAASVYLNQGGGEWWRRQVVATTGAHNIVLIDIGGNGRTGIYGANWTTDW